MDKRQFENDITPSCWVSSDVDITEIWQEWQAHLNRGMDVTLDIDITPYVVT